MAKLETRTTAGWNAGQNYYSRPFPVGNIVIDPEISRIFKISDKTLAEIARKMRASGYDKSQPVVIWKGENILVDGHTRLAAARETGLDEIPAVEMEFSGREEAILYTFERQVARRNLTGAEILRAAQMIHGRKDRDGSGRAAEQLAERLGVSPATVYQARKIVMEAPEEELKAVQNGEKSIKAVYNGITKPRREAHDKREPEPEADVSFAVSDAMSLPERIRFLKSAIVLLIEAREVAATKILVNHFLEKDEKSGFAGLLPENIREELDRVFLAPEE
jgi:ParB family chromosome partitioning protein